MTQAPHGPPPPRRPLDPDVAQLLAARGIDTNDDYLGSTIQAVLKLGAEGGSRGDVKILCRAVQEMRYAFKVFAAYRRVRKVSIFGSARTPPDAPAYRAAVEFASRMAGVGWMVITGAAEGIMQAGHAGAGAASSFGLAIRLPSEQQANAVIAGDPKLITFRHFFTRKLFFVKEASAVCLCPGGFGTHDEGFETLTLIQTGKAPPMPVVLLEEPGGGYWRGWLEFVTRQLRGRHYIDEQDLALVKITDQVDQAVAEIQRFYRRYHSIRFVRDDLVIRMTGPLTPEAIDALQQRFADILTGTIRPSPALPQEADQSDIAQLPRLIVPFNRRSFSRLRQMIDAINGF